ncbi:MAG: DinB family protein [Bryobacteraceae bacterium]
MFDREKAVAYLEASRQQLHDAVAGLSEAQWRFQPAAERWSVADCVEHIAVVEELILAEVEKALREPPRPHGDSSKDAIVLRAVPNRSRRVTAPEHVRPSRRWPDPAAAFDERRARSLAFARTTQADLRAHFYPHFILGDLDAYQWLLFLSAHAERHIAQLNEVKADPGFPA